MEATKPFLVVSDLHLGAVPKQIERAFRDFLRYAADHASGLLINGDLCDVWLATRHFLMRDHVRVLAGIADLVEAGVPVYFVGGNHDPLELGGHVLREDSRYSFTFSRVCRGLFDGERISTARSGAMRQKVPAYPVGGTRSVATKERSGPRTVSGSR